MKKKIMEKQVRGKKYRIFVKIASVILVQDALGEIILIYQFAEIKISHCENHSIYSRVWH